MAYVRALTFTVPPDRAEEMNPGHNLYLAAVHGTQIVAQNIDGFHKGGVWLIRRDDGSLKVTMYSQFNEMEPLDEYANVPMVRDFEQDVSTYLSPVVVEVYESLT